MKSLFVALSLILAALPFQVKAEDNTPLLYAVTFYADWCGSCKILDPEVDKARADGNLDSQDVLFVKLDLTNDTTKHQAALMADALDIEDFYKKNGGKTGFVVLFDAETDKEVGRLTKDMTAAEIVQTVEQKIKAL